MAEPVEAAPEAALDFSELFSSKTKGGGQRVPRSSAKASTTGPGELSVAEAPPRVVLQQYASSPLINFGEIAPKKAVVRALAVANESGRTQKVEVKPFESRDAMRVYPMSFEVPAHGQKELTLTWTPGAAGVLSKRLDLKWNQSNAVHAELRGTCSKVQRAPPTMVLAPAVKSLVAEPKPPLGAEDAMHRHPQAPGAAGADHVARDWASNELRQRHGHRRDHGRVSVQQSLKPETAGCRPSRRARPTLPLCVAQVAGECVPSAGQISPCLLGAGQPRIRRLDLEPLGSAGILHLSPPHLTLSLGVRA